MLSSGDAIVAGGERLGAVVAMRDVTERRAAETALREGEARFRLLAENSTDMITRHAPDGAYLYASPASLPLTGYAPEELVGRSPFEFLHPEDHAPVGAALGRALESPGAFTITYRGRRKDGAERWYETTGRPVRDPATGSVLELQASTRDVTERRRAEEELRRSRDELEARNAEQETFVYTVSHDLRTPLLSIQGMAGLLEEAARSGDADEAAYAAGRITRNVEKMGHLLNDVLALSRAGRSGEEAEALDLAPAVAAVMGELEPRLKARRVRVEVPDAWPTVRYPPMEAYRVLANLIGNAAKFAGREGEPRRVAVGWEAEGGLVTLRVSDNGPGVPPSFRERVFDLFKKIDPKSDGTGVGLAIVKRIAERHGGRVWVEDSPLGGAAFAVTMPEAC